MHDRPPRVLFVIGALGTGGAEDQITMLALAAHPHRLHASFATFDGAGGSAHERELVRAGIEHVTIGGGRGPLMIRFARVAVRFSRLVRRKRPDVVSLWLEEAAPLAAVARLHGVPAVITRMNTVGSVREANPILRWAIHRSERLARRVTGNAAAVTLDAEQSRGVSPGRTRVVLNGHQVHSASPAPHNDPVRLGYLARIGPYKGHSRLLRVLSMLPAHPAWRVTLGGTGPLEDEVRAEIERSGLADRVELAGLVSDAGEFWRQHDVAVLLSDTEGCPIALVEAAMVGRPIVATDVGGCGEIVAPGGGFVLPLDEDAAVAEALSRLIAERDLRERLGAAAHEQAVERFDVERFVDEHVQVFREAIADG